MSFDADWSNAQVAISSNLNSKRGGSESTTTVSFCGSNSKLPQLVFEAIHSTGFSTVQGTFVVEQRFRDDGDTEENEELLQRLADNIWSASRDEGLEVSTMVTNQAPDRTVEAPAADITSDAETVSVIELAAATPPTCCRSRQSLISLSEYSKLLEQLTTCSEEESKEETERSSDDASTFAEHSAKMMQEADEFAMQRLAEQQQRVTKSPETTAEIGKTTTNNNNDLHDMNEKHEGTRLDERAVQIAIDMSRPHGGQSTTTDEDNNSIFENLEPTSLVRSTEMRRANSLPGAFPMEGRSSFSVRGGGGRSPRLAERIFGTSSRTSAAATYSTPPTSSCELDVEQAPVTISAIPVDSTALEEELRRRIQSEAQMASIVEEKPQPKTPFCSGRILAFLLVATVLLISVSLFVGLMMSGQDPASSQADNMIPQVPPALATVLENDIVRCGLSEKEGFAFRNKTTSQIEGFEVDLCRALAAVVLNDADKVHTKLIPNPERFHVLNNGTVDMLTFTTTHTMSRDVHQQSTDAGFTFSTPYLYDGVAFAGDPFHVSCADNRTVSGNCNQLKVCVTTGTTEFDVVSKQLPAANLKTATSESLFDAFVSGECNVICGEGSKISEAILHKAGYTGPYQFGSDLVTRDPLTMVTRQDDSEWSLFVDTIIQALLVAEKEGITQQVAREHLMKQEESSIHHPDDSASLFDLYLLRAVAAVGNYGEMYMRHLESVFPRAGQNIMNDGSAGLIFSHPFGNVDNKGNGPIEGGILARILTRGYLICGIRPDRPGFAASEDGAQSQKKWTGMDADYCRTVAAALFGGSFDAIQFVEVDKDFSFADQGDGSNSTASVDIVAGALRSYALSVHNSFTQPYFYANTKASSTGDNYEEYLSMMTPSNDPQWSDFVFWLVSATFYAEEQHIHRFNANDMPEVHLFGPSLTRMFRDAILAVGNYGEMYFRNIQEEVEPRGGRNLINSNPFGPQHFPLYKTHSIAI